MQPKRKAPSISRSFKGIWIPASLWLNHDIPLRERCLMCEIDSLSTESRGCFASNAYLAMFLGMKQDSLKNLLVLMRKKGLITTTFDDEGNRELRLAIPIGSDKIVAKAVKKTIPKGNNKNVTGGHLNVHPHEHLNDFGGEHLNDQGGNANVHIDNSIRDKKKRKQNSEATASEVLIGPIPNTTHVEATPEKNGESTFEGANLKPPHDKNLEKDARAGGRVRAQEAFEKFRVKYEGTKRGHDTELKTLMKHKDWMEVAMILESALDAAAQARQAKAAKKEFVPNWPNLQTYLNQRRWEEHLEASADASSEDKFNPARYKSFQEAREAMQAEFLIDKDQAKRKRIMDIILNWNYPS